MKTRIKYSNVKITSSKKQKKNGGKSTNRASHSNHLNTFDIA